MRIQCDNVTYKKFLDDLARKVAEIIIESQGLNEMVTTEDAAKILGISPSRLRHIKDRFRYVKTGDSKQGKLLFDRNSLISNYTK